MQLLRRFIAQNPAKVFRDEPGTMRNMRCKTMKRKVKIFTACATGDGVDEEINQWIKENNYELLDVRVTFDRNKGYGFMIATATVIYIDKSEE